MALGRKLGCLTTAPAATPPEQGGPKVLRRVKIRKKRQGKGTSLIVSQAVSWWRLKDARSWDTCSRLSIDLGRILVTVISAASSPAPPSDFARPGVQIRLLRGQRGTETERFSPASLPGYSQWKRFMLTLPTHLSTHSATITEKL